MRALPGSDRVAVPLVAALALGCVVGCAGSKGAVKGDDGKGGGAIATPRERSDLERLFGNIFEVPEDAQIPANLLEPKSVEDAQNIVRSDNLALFAKADAVFAGHLAKQPDDLKNLTWHAQLYLAWADSAMMTRKTLGGSVDKLAKRQERLNEKLEDPELGEDERAEAEAALDELGWLVPLAEKTLAELEQVAEEKLAVGKEKTLAILDAHPDTYEGFRLGADYYRMSEEWDRFDKYMGDLEELNPDSNGLRFLKGVVAFSKEKDFVLAERHLSEAVDKDPKFTKAQYYLALSYLNRRRFEEANEAMGRTLEISPGHPFAHAVRAFISRYSKHE